MAVNVAVHTGMTKLANSQGEPMGQPISVYIYANDPILQAGVGSQLRGIAQVALVDQSELDQADVAIVVADLVDEGILRVLRAIQRGSAPRTVLIAVSLDESTVVAAAEAGVSGLLRRVEVTPERLLEVVRKVAAGEAVVPADLVARLLDQVGRLQRQVLAPRGLSVSGLSEREIEVLRLLAEGMDTAEIARQLSYSERTIKAVLHDVTARFQLRSRAHAVAYAVRAGLI
jgi:DNA-binding NarL/FixJ family response regulator